jgi:hypothetical protein
MYKVLVEKPKGKSPLRRPTHEWAVNKVVDWIHMAQGSDQWSALVNTVINLLVS